MLQKWRRLQPFMLTASMVAPLLLAVPMLWGFGGQLHATAYPDDWQRADKLLSADRTQFHTLFLPWHLYMYLGFADRLVANPAPQFFAVPLTASQDPELGELSTPARYMRERAIESSVLPGAASSYNLGAQLAPFGIKYIVMAKEFDYQKYEYLAAQSDLVMIYDGPTMSVYQNKLFTGVPPWPGK